MLSTDWVYHITTAIAWQNVQQQGKYVHPSLTSEGFIHCSYRHQVAATATLYFQGQTELILLGIEPQHLTERLKVEPSRNGELFPHLYGPLNLDAVALIVPAANTNHLVRILRVQSF